MLVQQRKPKTKAKPSYEDVAEFDILQEQGEVKESLVFSSASDLHNDDIATLVALPASSSLFYEDTVDVPYAISPNDIPVAKPPSEQRESIAVVPPPYTAQMDAESVQSSMTLTTPQVMSLSEWMNVHGLGAYLDRLKTEDVTELAHFQDLTDDDVQALVDKWQMSIRTRRIFLSAVGVLRQTLACPPSYDEPVLEAKVNTIVSQLAECVEKEDDRAILALMTSQTKVESVQEQCIEALLVLARSDVNKVSLMEADAHLALISVLKVHARSTKLLEDATGALWHIVLFADFENGQYIHRDHSNDSNKDLLMKLDVPSQLIAALKAHPESIKLARHSLGILWSLATADSGKDTLADMDVSATLLDVMKIHLRDQQVQVNGCGFLWSLASRKSTQSPLHVHGGRAVVEAALNAFPHAKQVQKFGNLALKRLPP